MSTPNTSEYEPYKAVVVSPNYEPFHEDYDSTFVDSTTDCLHFTFKNGHQCEFIKNNPTFK